MRHAWIHYIWLLSAAALFGCVATDAESPASCESVSECRTYDICETVHACIARLPDRTYVRTYGDADNPRLWYTAAEALGELGKPAIPALIERLDTPDPYELKLAVYALMLASQDPLLLAETDGDYLKLDTVLVEETNHENREYAHAWWQRYQHLWP